MGMETQDLVKTLNSLTMWYVFLACWISRVFPLNGTNPPIMCVCLFWNVPYNSYYFWLNV